MEDIEYLKTLRAVRDRAHLVLEAAEQGDLTHFDYNAERMTDVASFVAGVINVCPHCKSMSWLLACMLACLPVCEKPR